MIEITGGPKGTIIRERHQLLASTEPVIEITGGVREAHGDGAVRAASTEPVIEITGGAVAVDEGPVGVAASTEPVIEITGGFPFTNPTNDGYLGLQRSR